MNTKEIVSILSSNKSTKSNFIGCFPVDQLPNVDMSKHVKFSLVVNLDVSTGPGTHWCGIYYRKKKMFYFDSFGKPPSSSYLKKWCKNYVNRVYFNNLKHQKNSSLRCGGFCCWFIFEMSRGTKFHDVINFLDSINYDDKFIKSFMKDKMNFEII